MDSPMFDSVSILQGEPGLWNDISILWLNEKNRGVVLHDWSVVTTSGNRDFIGNMALLLEGPALFFFNIIWGWPGYHDFMIEVVSFV